MYRPRAVPTEWGRSRSGGPGIGLGGALAALAALVLLLVAAGPAAAHDPIFLTDDQTTPETGPYLPDGTISFAIYGSLAAPAETRGMEFDLRDGDDLYLSLLIPDLEPEVSLTDGDLPIMTLITPDGAERLIEPDLREPFDEPFSGTKYLTLYETVEPAQGGRHQVVVTGESASRFVVAIGTTEEFFTETERAVDRPTSFPGIAAPLERWYTTPADGSAPTDDAEGVDMDVEAVEEALADNQTEGEDEGDGDGAVESGTADQADGTEAEASAPADPDGADGGTTWVAPVAVAVVAIVGAGFFLARRNRADV